jgi:hypothetical protein
MFADGSGTATWLRIGTLDSEGIWGVNLTIDGEQTVENYSVSQFQLSNQGTELVGIEMRKYQGSVSDTYYSLLRTGPRHAGRGLAGPPGLGGGKVPGASGAPKRHHPRHIPGGQPILV